MLQRFSPSFEWTASRAPSELIPCGETRWFLIDVCLGRAESLGGTSVWRELVSRKGSVICGTLADSQPVADSSAHFGHHHLLRHETEVVVIDDAYQMKAVLLSTWRHGNRMGFVRPATAKSRSTSARFEAGSIEDDTASEANGYWPEPIRRLFCYGTLMRGEVRHVALTGIGPSSISPGSVPGRLFDLGSYPGLLPPTSLGEQTLGELYEFAVADTRWAEGLAATDRIEGFHGLTATSNDYLRMLTWVRTANGAKRLAWVYVYCGNDSAMKSIANNDWKNR